MFSVVSILFLPPGAVSGIMGMNVRVRWAEYEDSQVPFTCLTIFSIVWVIGMYAWIYWQDKKFQSKNSISQGELTRDKSE